MSRPRVERVVDVDGWEGWESWCRQHPMPNGDTGVAFDHWRDALDHCLAHANTHHHTPTEKDTNHG